MCCFKKLLLVFVAMSTVDLFCLFGQVDLGLMGLVPDPHELTRPISVILVLIPKCNGLSADLYSASILYNNELIRCNNYSLFEG